MDTSNLKNLKTESDAARQTYLESLKALQDSLPEGVKLMIDGGEFDGTNVGNSKTEQLVQIASKRDVKIGDILRLVGDVPEAHTYSHIVEKGRDYRVVHIDGCNDPHIVSCEDGSYRRIDTCGMLRHFVIVRGSNDASRESWVVLTRENRNRLDQGSIVRATRFGRDLSLTEGRQYEIVRKPDRDGRFRDDRGDMRDTCGFYDGELELKIS